MKRATLCISAGLLITAAAFGRYTVISDAGYGSEPALSEVLNIVAPVPGGWGSIDDLNSNTNGLRVSDNADQVWNSGSKVTVLTTFWGGAAEPGDTGGHYVRYDSSDAYVIGVGGGTFGAWSNEAMNSGTISDRAVTFDVSGLDVYAWTAGDKNNSVTSLVSSPLNSSAYIVAFETGRDGDYQDMLVLIEQGRIIPAPGAIVLSCCGALFVGWLRRRQVIV